MREITQWLRRILARRHEAIQQTPGRAALSVVRHNIIAERAHPGMRLSTQGIERSIDNEGAPGSGLEDDFAEAILFIGSTIEPYPGTPE